MKCHEVYLDKPITPMTVLIAPVSTMTATSEEETDQRNG